MEVQEKDGLISCDYIQFGDYDNSCAVERANVRYLEKKGLITELKRFACGGVQAWIDDTEENRELLNSLENYPCFDDELVSEIETEIEDDYLRDNSSDLTKLLTCKDIIEDVLFLDFDRELYEKAKDETNTYFEVESGGNGYIDFKRLAPAYELLLCEKYPAIKTLMARKELLETVPSYPNDFYESAEDHLNHLQQTTGLGQERKELLEYTAELERIIGELKI